MIEVKHQSLVVVGNGAMKHMAQVIDYHDRVVRLNTYVMDGYEEHIGTRQDIVCASPVIERWNDQRFMEIADVSRELWFPIPQSKCLTDKRNACELFEGKFRTKMYFPCDWFWDRFSEAHVFPSKKHASTGFKAIHIALYLNYKVSIIGFDGAKSGHYWNEKHYHFRIHDWKYESDAIQALIDAGKVKRL